MIFQQPTPQETHASPAEIQYQVRTQHDQHQQQGGTTRTQNHQVNNAAAHSPQSLAPLVKVLEERPASPVEIQNRQIQTLQAQSQKQGYETKLQKHQHNKTTAQAQQGILPFIQTSQGIEIQFPRPQVSDSASTLRDQQFVEALYRHLETAGPEDEFKTLFKSCIGQAQLDEARDLTQQPYEPLSKLSKVCEAHLQVQNTEAQEQSLQGNDVQDQVQAQQVYRGQRQYPQSQDGQLRNEHVVYDTSLQTQQPLAHAIPQAQMQRLPGDGFQPRAQQQQISIPQPESVQPIEPHLQNPQPEDRDSPLSFLQTLQEQVEFQQAYDAEYSRLQTIQEDQDTVGRLLVSKRDLLHTKGILFEDLAQMYWDLLDTAQEAGQRSCINDWIEDLSIQLLEMLQRMEEDEFEIQQLEIRFRDMDGELNRIF